MTLAPCPRCGHESDSDICPLCGSDMAGGGEAGTGGSGRPGAESGTADARSAGARGTSRVPWEDPSLGFPENAALSWRQSLFDPASFFRRIDHGASMSRPILYYLLVAVLGSFFLLIWQAYLYAPLTGEAGMYGGGVYVVQFFATPFVVLFALAMQTLVLHVFVLMLAPERRSMGATARVICYAYGPFVLAAVPILGSLAGGIWVLVLQVIGIREVHRTSTGRAVAVVLAPLVLLIGAGIFLAVLVALTLGQGELASAASVPLPLP